MNGEKKRESFGKTSIKIFIWAAVFYIVVALITPALENIDITTKSLLIKIPISIIFGGIMAFLEKYNIKDKVELIMEKGYLIIKPKESPRKGWEKAFKRMRDNQDDILFIDDVFMDEDLEEWK